NRRKNGDKGGLAAVDALVKHVAGGAPGYLAVDGPRGPRNRVHKGIAMLSQRTGAAVVNLVAVPSRRWIFTRAWDRFQIPKPFATIHGYFGEPLFPRKGESVEQYRRRIETALNELERKHDPTEAELAGAATREALMELARIRIQLGMF
ncbi:MAG: lysophospholipid acyltransferase family protein, partial [Pirellulales bacterium]